MPENDAASRYDRMAEAIRWYQSLDVYQKEAVREVIEQEEDADKVACPECGLPLTTARRPTIHYSGRHPGTSVPEVWPPGL